MLNLLDVPIEIIELPSRSRSASADFPSILPPSMTYDPQDRYKKVYRQPPSKLPRQYASTGDLCNHSPDIGVPPKLPRPRLDGSPHGSGPESSLPRQRSLKYNRADKPQSRPANWPLVDSRFDKSLPPDPPGSAGSVYRDSLVTALSPLQPFAPSVRMFGSSRPSTRYGTSSSPSSSNLDLTCFPRPAGSVSYCLGLEQRNSQGGDSFNRAYAVRSPPSAHYDNMATESDAEDMYYEAEEGSTNTGNEIVLEGLGISIHAKQQGFDRRSLEQSLDEPHYAETLPRDESSDALTKDWVASERSGNDTDTHLIGLALTHPSPPADTPTFEFSSPTFTAETISSEGFNSPFRLSTQFHHDTTSIFDIEQDASLTDVARRLSRLHTGDEPEYHHNDHKQLPYYYHHNNNNNNLDGCYDSTVGSVTTLKSSLAAHDANDAYETHDPKRSPTEPLGAAADENRMTRNEPQSFTDAIFDELSYLRTAIH